MTRVGDSMLERADAISDEHTLPTVEAPDLGALLSLPDLRSTKDGRRRLVLARRDGRWDRVRVAEHLMSCRGQMIFGLRHKSPWAGLDVDTLDSCFGAAAALVVELAASGKRADWRTADDLEKAQIAAYRNQVRDHWKRVNAQARVGDRLSVVFDPERHATPDAQLERLYAQPDLFEIRRDLLAELTDPGLLAFWQLVFDERLSFKVAGDRLGLTKSQVVVRTRSGRAFFSSYLDRRGSGGLCIERGVDIDAARAGTATDAARERAEAHLESCYGCSLVYAPRTSAFDRGMLGLAPIGLVLRLSTRLGEAATSAVMRCADAGPGARVAAGGLAAAALAGSAVGLEAATSPAPPAAEVRAAPVRQPPTGTLPREVFRSPGLLITPTVTAAPSAAAAATRPVARPRAASQSTTTTETPVPATVAPPPAPAPTPPPAKPEFSLERGDTAAPAEAAPAAPSPATTEFAGP
ncbi:MAG: hypothetical protein WKF94_11750 [Solirubrobacteraceae bacterium]